MEIVTSWMEQGIEQGIKEGIVQEAKSLVLRLLNRKFGEVPASVRSQIDALSIAQLEALGEALLDFTQPEELTAWLAESQAS